MATVVAITTDTATPAIRRLVVRASGRSAFAAMAASVANLIREHLVRKDQIPNRLGGTRTHFYAAAARGTNWTAGDNSAEVTIAKDGIRQRLLGGTIRPVNRKFLTVPVSPLAHGRTAAEFGAELRLVVFGGTASNANAFGMLVLGRGAVANVLYLLVRKVTQAPDPTVLPTDQEIADEALSALREAALAE